MKLESLTIKDFRGIRDLELNFDRNLTIIVGRNGVGKTSILDAIAILLQPLRMLWPDAQGQHQLRKPKLKKEDLRYGAEDCFIGLKYQIDTSRHPLSEIAEPPEKVETWYSEIGSRKINRSIQDLWNFANSPYSKVHTKPLFAYYHQDRGFKNGSKSKDVFDPDALQETSLQADLRAINDLQTWWDKIDAQEARQVRDNDPTFRDPQLQAVRGLVRAIDSFSDISFSSTSSRPGLYLTKKDGSVVHVDNLSSGERSYIILIADLARRLHVIAPESPLQEIPGVVLIDEIELNLHPAWQSEIVTTLSKTFKKCQFIVTTHSPQVISAVESDNIRILSKLDNGNIAVESAVSTKGRTSNYLLEGIFRSSERYPPLDHLIDEFNDAIERSDISRAAELLNELSEGIEGQPPELLLLKKRLTKLEAKS